MISIMMLLSSCRSYVDKDRGDGSVKELFKMADPERNDSETYNEAMDAYDRNLNDIFKRQKEMGISAQPHFQAAYIDGDDIPELLVSYGDFHSSGICVYRYDPETGEVSYLGEFGSFGGFSYRYKSGIMESTYGNHGYYMTYVSGINGNSVVLKDVWLIDGSGIRNTEEQYYHGFLVPDGIYGSRESFANTGSDELSVNIDPDGYNVSKEELNSIEETWGGRQNDMLLSVSYAEMLNI